MDEGPRKRVRQSETSHRHNQSSGRRGRPRLDVSDQTSRDRRRTQIRLAQRAYRERKEDAITTLTRRVEHLQNVVADMGSTFSDFKSRAETSSNALEQLQQTSDQMLALAAKSVDQVEQEGSDEEEATSDSLESLLSARKAQTPPNLPPPPPGTRSMDQPWGYRTAFAEAPRRHSNPQADLPWKFSSTGWPARDENSGNLQGFGVSGQSPQPSSQQRSGPPNSVLQPVSQPQQHLQLDHQSQQPWTSASYDAFVTSAPTQQSAIPSLPVELPVPQGYNHLESSFTRRLIRASMEGAMRLMRDEHANPAEVQRLGRYAMCYMQRHCLPSWFEGVWARPANENLERWKVPLYHIGGAGLHFPRQGIDANSTPPENWADQGRIGPLQPRPTEYPNAIGTHSTTGMVDFANVTGEWFDSNDVDQYLRTKGLFLDSTSSIVDISDEEVPSLSTATSYSESLGPPSPDLNTSLEPVTGTERAGHIGPYWMMDNDFATPGLQSGAFNGFGTRERMRAKKIFDVDAFVTDLLKESTCLGRTLCFRKDVVEMALKAATMQIPVSA